MYQPQFQPRDAASVNAWSAQELQNIAKEMASPKEFLLLQVSHKAPKTTTDPKIAMLAIADGTNWNPGAGAGLYRFQNNSWTFVG